MKNLSPKQRSRRSRSFYQQAGRVAREYILTKEEHELLVEHCRRLFGYTPTRRGFREFLLRRATQSIGQQDNSVKAATESGEDNGAEKPQEGGGSRSKDEGAEAEAGEVQVKKSKGECSQDIAAEDVGEGPKPEASSLALSSAPIAEKPTNKESEPAEDAAPSPSDPKNDNKTGQGELFL